MKIWTLTENTTCRDDLTAEHGLSLYIETGSSRILFDTGKSDAFANNAEKLGVDLAQVNLCILSHGHYDHGGGLSRFLQVNPTAPIYLQDGAFAPHFSSGKYIGLDPALEGHPRMHTVFDTLELTEGISLVSCNDLPRPYPFGVFGQTVLEIGSLQPEDYRHEQYLLIEEAGKRFCFSGCSHKGILNIVHWLRPDVLIGGFHFMKLDPQGDALASAARLLCASPTSYYTGHCTGHAQYAALKALLGDRISLLQTGTILNIT